MQGYESIGMEIEINVTLHSMNQQIETKETKIAKRRKNEKNFFLKKGTSVTNEEALAASKKRQRSRAPV